MKKIITAILLLLSFTTIAQTSTVTVSGKNINWDDKITKILILTDREQDTLKIEEVKKSKPFSITLDATQDYTLVFFNGETEENSKRVYISGHNTAFEGVGHNDIDITIDWDNPDYLAGLQYSHRHDRYFILSEEALKERKASTNKDPDIILR